METSGLLPTPEALNSEGYQTSGGKKWPRLGKVIQELLPTPRAGNPGSRPNKKGGKILAEVVATSSQEDSLANPSHKLDEEKERQTTMATGMLCIAETDVVLSVYATEIRQHLSKMRETPEEKERRRLLPTLFDQTPSRVEGKKPPTKKGKR